MRFFLLVLLTTSLIQISVAQSFNKKWGKVSAKETALQSTELDKEASALILGEYGQINIINGKIFIDKYVRLKILNQNGIEHANVTLPYYTKNDVELITNVKAQTINRLSNGKLERTEISKKEVYTTDLNELWKAKKFTFQKVKPGSIIEYRFRKESRNFYYLDDWYFQKELPVLHSELTVTFPDYFEYSYMMYGSRLVKKYKNQSTNTFVLTQLPPVKKQQYVYDMDDYVEKIKFQLVSYMKYDNDYGSNSVVKVDVMQTWDKLAEEVKEDSEFSSYAGHKDHYSEIVEKVITEDMAPVKKVELLYDYVVNNFHWNERNSVYCRQRFKDLQKSKKGNTAEINNYLVRLLQNAGLKAYPMLISTREHGKITKSYPLLSQFNRVVAYVELSDQKYVLNAIDPLRPYLYPATSDYVDEGFVIRDVNSSWVTIDVRHKSEITSIVEVNFDQSGIPITEFSMGIKGYHAYNYRRGLINKGQKYILDKLYGDKLELLDEMKIENVKNLKKRLIVKFKVKELDSKIINGNMIYLDPFVYDQFRNNPFNEERKTYPIELPFEDRFNCIIKIHLPDGFKVESMPGSEGFKLPSNFGSFSYHSKISDEVVEVNIKVLLNKRRMPSSYNDYMKEFYDIIIEKLNEQVVLKRSMS